MRVRLRRTLAPIRDVFANRDLRRIELAFAGSVIGLYAYYIAIAVYAYRHGGATAVGLLTFVRLLAAAGVAPFAASLADRLRRERVMLAVNLARAAAVALAAVSAFAGAPALVVYALATLVSMIGTPFRPAEASLLPELARTPEELTAANATSSTFDSAGCFIGPALAGFLLAVSSPAAVFVVTAAGFLWSALFIAMVHPEREPPAEEGSGPEQPYDEAPEYPPMACVAGGGADVCVGVGDGLCVVGGGV